MRWADALAASPVKRAERRLKDPEDRDEPNVVIRDPKFNPFDQAKAIKSFHAREGRHGYGWSRTPLRLADRYDDWEPGTKTSDWVDEEGETPHP